MLEPGAEEPPHEDFRYREFAGDIAQTQLVIGWRTPGTLDTDTVRWTSRRQCSARGAPRACTARCGSGGSSRRSVRPTTRPRSWACSRSTRKAPPSSAADAACEAWAQVAAMRDVGVHPGELERARSACIESQWVRRLEDDGRPGDLPRGVGSARRLDVGGRVLRGALGASADDVTAAMRRHLGRRQRGRARVPSAERARIAADGAAMRALLDGARAYPVVAPVIAAEAPAIRTGPASPEREEAGVQHVPHRGRGADTREAPQPGSPLVHLGVFALGGASNEEESAAGLTYAHGAHGDQGHRAPACRADIRGDGAAGRTDQRAGGLGTLGLVHLRAGGAGDRGARSARGRRAERRPSPPPRSRPSARWRSPISRSCATTCTAGPSGC